MRLETLMSVADKVDPIKLNRTLTATADALDGLGDRFGQSVVHGNQILDDLIRQMPQIRRDTMAAVGLAATGGDTFERGGLYLIRGTQDLIPTSGVLDMYSPELFCMLRNYSDADVKAARVLGGNGFSSQGWTWLVGPGNPYVYPDNLPTVNARGGPERQPGCWQPVTRDLWPAPYLVMDTGDSIAPYNHFALGQPILIDYVWGRQIGENTIYP
jgi:phospholipid/cholesterol/gamma-HCH transport system substrate-binding protein